jgi:predicted dehydrogenase
MEEKIAIRIGLVGVDSSHAEDFLRHFNREARHRDMQVTRIWGGDENRTAELLAHGPALHAADSLEALLAEVDAVIVGDRHGDLHLPHALPAIAAGKPVFIDKPLTCRLDDAIALVDAAERAGTPLLSASALRWHDDVVILKARLAYLDGPVEIAAHGTWTPDSEHGGAIYYAIHVVELAQELAGTDWRGLRREPGEATRLRYDSARASVTLAFRPPDAHGAAFGVSVRSPQLRCERPILLSDDYMAPVVDRIAAMLRSGRGMSRETLLAPMRMMEEIEGLLG